MAVVEDNNTWDPGILEYSTAYYWRIDEFDGSNVFKGNVWSFATSAPFDPNLNLSHHWKLNEASGTIAGNSVSSKHGTLQGNPQWVSSQVGGYALKFDGIDDYVALPDNNPVWLPTNNFTISLWVCFTNYAAGTETIIDLNGASDSGTTGFRFGYFLQRQSNGRCMFNMITDGGGDLNFEHVLNGNTVLQGGRWYHIAVRRNGTILEMHVNGTLDNNSWCTSYPVDFIGDYYDDNKVNIGRFSKIGVSNTYLKGVIDDVRIYGTALSADEIRQLHVKDTPRTATKPFPAEMTSNVNPDIALGWLAGYKAISHDVYFGTSFSDVNNAVTPTAVLDVNYYDPGVLQFATIYYWRIDESDGINKYKGSVWSFTIAICKAFEPSPVDGTAGVARVSVLSWKPGYDAISHNIYLGTDYNNVNNSSSPIAIRDTNSYAPALLKPDTTYYWRVDEYDGSVIHKGNVWSFTVNSGTASNPNPSNAAQSILTDLILTWTAGWSGTITHHVYLGTNFNDVNDSYAPVAIIEDINSYNPGKLEYSTAYYWRIDEFDGSTACKGNVWNFTTLAPFDPNSNLAHHWKFDEASGTIAGNSVSSKHGTLQGNPQRVFSPVGGYALKFDGIDDYVALPDNNPVWLPTNNFTFSFWVYFANDAAKDETMIDLNGIEIATDRSGYFLKRLSNGSYKFYIVLYPDVAQPLIGNTILKGRTWYHIAMQRGGRTSAVYINGMLDKTGFIIQNAVDFVGSEDDNKVSIGRYSKTGTSEAYLNGIIDDLRIYNKFLTVDEVRQLYSGYGLTIPEASEPDPADEETDVAPDRTLSWSAQQGIISHDVYLGTNFDDVNNAVMPTAVVYVNCYDPAVLEFEATYYWRIDENDGTNKYKGSVWSFTTTTAKASNPKPSYRAAGIDPCSIILSWTAGYGAISHNVYFGTNYGDVNDAIVPIALVDVNYYNLCDLEDSRTYYWRSG